MKFTFRIKDGLRIPVELSGMDYDVTISSSELSANDVMLLLSVFGSNGIYAIANMTIGMMDELTLGYLDQFTLAELCDEE